MHGGNAGIIGQLERNRDGAGGEEGGKECRLDDLWQMNLIRSALFDSIWFLSFSILLQCWFRSSYPPGYI